MAEFSLAAVAAKPAYNKYRLSVDGRFPVGSESSRRGNHDARTAARRRAAHNIVGLAA